MELKVFSLSFCNEKNRFDDHEMITFLQNKRVLEVREHFFIHAQNPNWVLLVSYRESVKVAALPSTKNSKPDWRAELEAPVRPLFDALRQWRNEKAKSDGVPAYVLLTNRQMAAVAERRPSTISQLQEIDGVGESRTERWGKEVLALIAAYISADEKNDHD